MKSFLMVCLIFLFLPGRILFAQTTTDDTYDDNKPKRGLDSTRTGMPDWKAIRKKLVFGGTVGLSIYPDNNRTYTFLQLAPQVGYKVKPNLIAGAGIQFMSITSRGTEGYVQYGPDLFLRAHIANTFFAQAQFEYLNFEDSRHPGGRLWNPAMLAGFGYGTMGGSLGVFVNLINNNYSSSVYPGSLYLGGIPILIRGQIFF